MSSRKHAKKTRRLCSMERSSPAPELLRRSAEGASHICRKCARQASDARTLCKPNPL